MTEAILRIAVIGTGGVGGFFGAKLALAGHDVTFIARGRHLDAIRAGGLRVESAAAPMHVQNAHATDAIASIPPVDVVMLCVKLWDVESAASGLHPALADGGVVIPFQNGLDAPQIVARALGAERVIGGVAYIAATIRGPGVIAHTGSMAKLRVGAFPGGPADKADAFATACKGAGIDIEVSADIRLTLWEKFCFLSAFSGCTCAARQPIGIVRSDPDLRATFEAAVTEGWTAGRAHDVPLSDDYVARQMKATDALPAEMKASMLHDLEAGRRLEAPWLSGAVVRLAQEKGLAAPVSRTLYAAVKPYVNGAPA